MTVNIDAARVRMARWLVAWWDLSEESDRFDAILESYNHRRAEYEKARAEHNEKVAACGIFQAKRLYALSSHESEHLDPWEATLDQEASRIDEWAADYDRRLALLNKERAALGNPPFPQRRPEGAYHLVAVVGMSDPEPVPVAAPQEEFTYPSIPDDTLPPPPDYASFEVSTGAAQETYTSTPPPRSPSPDAASLDDIF